MSRIHRKKQKTNFHFCLFFSQINKKLKKKNQIKLNDNKPKWTNRTKWNTKWMKNILERKKINQFFRLLFYFIFWFWFCSVFFCLPLLCFFSIRYFSCFFFGEISFLFFCPDVPRKLEWTNKKTLLQRNENWIANRINNNKTKKTKENDSDRKLEIEDWWWWWWKNLLLSSSEWMEKNDYSKE